MKDYHGGTPEPVLTEGAGSRVSSRRENDPRFLLAPGLTAIRRAQCSKLLTHTEPTQPNQMSTDQSAIESFRGHQLLRLH